MATGQRAFSGPTTAVIFDGILHKAPTSPAQLNTALPTELERIISKALEKDRDLRYHSAGDLRADLKRLKRDTDSGRAAASPASLGAGNREAAAGAALALPSLERPVASAFRRRWPLILAAAGLVLTASAGVAWFFTQHRHPQTQLVERQITANPMEDWVTGAAISPDGKHIAYHDQTALYLRSVDSGETHAVSLPAGFHNRIVELIWFPDGGKLLAGVIDSEGVSLWVITIFGGAAPHLLYRRAGLAAISPDGQSVAFVGCEPWDRGDSAASVGGWH